MVYTATALLTEQAAASPLAALALGGFGAAWSRVEGDGGGGSGPQASAEHPVSDALVAKLKHIRRVGAALRTSAATSSVSVVLRAGLHHAFGAGRPVEPAAASATHGGAVFGPALPWEAKFDELVSAGLIEEGAFRDAASARLRAVSNEVALGTLERFAAVNRDEDAAKRESMLAAFLLIEQTNAEER